MLRSDNDLPYYHPARFVLFSVHRDGK